MNDPTPPRTSYWLVHAIRDPVDGGRPTTLTHEKRARRPAFTSRAFCQACQGGWMRRLDEAVRPAMAKLVVAEPIVLDRDERARLADWAGKTMLAWLMKEPAAREDALGVSGLYSSFGRTKEPLPGMHLWIGHRLHDEGVWFRAFSLSRKNTASDMDEAAPAFGAVFAIRHLVVLLLHSGTPDLRVRLVGNALAAMTPIFPDAGGPVSLPRTYGWAGRDLSQLPEMVTRCVRVTH